MKTLEEITIENENLKRGNVKVWEQLEKSTEILSHHEAYILLLEEENTKLKELLKDAKNVLKMVDTYCGDYDSINGFLIVEKINQVLGEE